MEIGLELRVVDPACLSFLRFVGDVFVPRNNITIKKCADHFINTYSFLLEALLIYKDLNYVVIFESSRARSP